MTLRLDRFKYLLAQKEKRDGVTISQIDLAQKLGVAPKTVSTWMTGRHAIDAAHLVAICDFLHTTADYILGRADDPGEYWGLRSYERAVLTALNTFDFPELLNLIDALFIDKRNDFNRKLLERLIKVLIESGESKLVRAADQ